MSNIHTFPPRGTFNPIKVQIDGGLITKSTDPRHIGTTRYFVDIVESDGCHIGLWDGADYTDALREAVETARELGAVIVDKVEGGAR